MPVFRFGFGFSGLHPRSTEETNWHFGSGSRDVGAACCCRKSQGSGATSLECSFSLSSAVFVAAGWLIAREAVRESETVPQSSEATQPLLLNPVMRPC